MNWINWLTTILSSENRLALWKHSKKRRDFSIMYSVICTGMSNQQNVWPITWSKWPITALPEVQPQSLPNTEQRWVCPGWPPSLVGQPVRPLHVAFACVQMYIFFVSYVKERCFLTFFCRISPGDLPLKFFNCFFLASWFTFYVFGLHHWIYHWTKEVHCLLIDSTVQYLSLDLSLWSCHYKLAFLTGTP